jgi:hypothetical protein
VHTCAEHPRPVISPKQILRQLIGGVVRVAVRLAGVPLEDRSRKSRRARQQGCRGGAAVRVFVLCGSGGQLPFRCGQAVEDTAGSCRMPRRRITARERAFGSAVKETSSSRPSSSNAKAAAARAASVANPCPQAARESRQPKDGDCGRSPRRPRRAISAAMPLEVGVGHLNQTIAWR